MWFIPCYSNQNAGIPTSSQSVQVVDFNAPVVNTLTQLWQPLVSHGQLKRQQVKAKTLFRDTTFHKVDTTDLIATATKLRKSEGTCLEIGSCLLGAEAVEDIQKKINLTSFFSDQKVTINVLKLVIAIPGDHTSIFNLDSVPERVGTLEVVLNSAFTGGELQLVCDGQITNLEIGPYSWVAVQGNAVKSISPVTSGARVSLIFDVNVLSVPVDSTAMYTYGTFTLTRSHLLDHMLITSLDITKLIHIAEQLKPEFTGQRHLTIDACVLNSATLAVLGRQANVSALFGTKDATVIPRYLTVHRNEGKLNDLHEERENRREGYLGTLVMTIGSITHKNTSSYSSTHMAYLKRNGKHITVFPALQNWYAYKADTTQSVDPCYNGKIVALHYDIYSAAPSVAVHNPLPIINTSTETPSILTRSVVSDTLREKAQAVLETELASTDAVIITLQHMFPEGLADQLWNTYPSYLQGGDRLLYDILTGTSLSEVYDVQLVEVTIRYRYDKVLKYRKSALLHTLLTRSLSL